MTNEAFKMRSAGGKARWARLTEAERKAHIAKMAEGYKRKMRAKGKKPCG
jgi:hypothetical protein